MSDRESTTVGYEEAITQQQFEELANSERGRNAEEINIEPEYDDDGPVIDLNAVSFPNLKRLTIKCQGIKAINMSAENYPKLESFDLESPGGSSDVEYIDFSLPELTFMSCQFVTVEDSQGFGKSLSRSPKLESFTSYKLWGLGSTNQHTLVLPNCETLDLYRSDDLRRLKLWAPKLSYLNLQACYSIKSVTVLDRKPPGYKAPEYNFDGQFSPYTVNFINTSAPGGNVLSHERCAGYEGERDREDDCTVM